MDVEGINITISIANLLVLLGVARKVFVIEHQVKILWTRSGIETNQHSRKS